MAQPYTRADLIVGEQIVRELHGLKGYDEWAQRIAQALAAERDTANAYWQKLEDGPSFSNGERS